MFKNLVVASTLLFAFASYADQCQVITLNQARRAYEEVKRAQLVDALCELCGQSTPERLFVDDVQITRSSYQDGKTRYYEVLVNGRSIDLAYTYVDGKNLANKVGCPAVGVSDTIPVSK